MGRAPSLVHTLRVGTRAPTLRVVCGRCGCLYSGVLFWTQSLQSWRPHTERGNEGAATRPLGTLKKNV
jgi:hypothetical protein